MPESQKTSDKTLREIAWDLGTHYPPKKSSDVLALATQQPHQGFFYWHLEHASIEGLQKKYKDSFWGAAHVVRIYDVSDLQFDGHNAHSFFDIDVSGLEGRRFFHTDHSSRSLIAEIGFRLENGAFHALARSSIVFFDRSASSGNYEISGLYVNSQTKRSFPVGNIFDSAVYERFSRIMVRPNMQELPGLGLLHIEESQNEAWNQYLRKLIEHWRKMGFAVKESLPQAPKGVKDSELPAAFIKQIAQDTLKSWKAQGVGVFFAHGFLAGEAQLSFLKNTSDIFVIALSCEDLSEGRQQNLTALLSRADRIIVPDLQCEQILHEKWKVLKGMTYVIPHIFEEECAQPPDPGSVKQAMHLHPAQPLALFVGEISHAAGADLLADAIFQVAGTCDLQFVFVGEGPLRDELEGRMGCAGLGHRVRFVGDVAHDWFEQILMASEFVVMPARTWQDSTPAQIAVDAGRPVLTTHQAHVGCVQHGQNGLVTYDNPGSIVWGLKEMIENPLQANMMRVVARQHAEQGKTQESVAVEHLICFLDTLSRRAKGGTCG